MMPEIVVVITGASSGIGRATALEFGRRGANVIVAARRQELLTELAEEINKLGGQAIAVPTDVSNESEVQRLAAVAYQAFGRIDVWVNNAAVTAFGGFEQIPSHVFNRVIEVNVIGYANGARAVLPYFRRQNQGILINVASVVGTIAQPYASAYTASKFAIRGLSEALQLELDKTPIKVCTVLPGCIDTPLFHEAANYSGRELKALHRVYAAQEVADKIISLVKHPKNEVYAGGMTGIMSNMHKFAPKLSGKYFARQIERDQFKDKPARPAEGNLFEPMPEFSGVSGGWKAKRNIM